MIKLILVLLVGFGAWIGCHFVLPATFQLPLFHLGSFAVTLTMMIVAAVVLVAWRAIK